MKLQTSDILLCHDICNNKYGECTSIRGRIQYDYYPRAAPIASACSAFNVFSIQFLPSTTCGCKRKGRGTFDSSYSQRVPPPLCSIQRCASRSAREETCVSGKFRWSCLRHRLKPRFSNTKRDFPRGDLTILLRASYSSLALWPPSMTMRWKWRFAYISALVSADKRGFMAKVW